MKNKNGKVNVFVVIALIAVLAFGVFFLFSTNGKTILEHKEPADLSEKEKGTGLDLRFYDEDGNEIQIPDWFSTSSIVPIGGFSIVRHPPAPTCTVRTQCTGYDTNPNIMCWTGKCVIGNVASMDAGVNVQNPIASELTFLNVGPISALPAVFWTNIDQRKIDLVPGESASWGTAVSGGGLGPFSISQFEGSQQTFTIEVEGTNEFTGIPFSVTDSITLAFDTNPAGTFIISIETGVPA